MEDGNAHYVELDSFPGGPPTFELITRLCYNASLQATQNGHEEDCLITPNNVAALRNAIHFLEMTHVNEADNLLQKTLDFLAGMPFWSLSQCMSLLKSYDGLPDYGDNVHIIQQCISLISSKASSYSSTSTPTCFSPESQHSSNETRSSDPQSYACLYEDITQLSIPMMKKLMLAMIANHVDNKFLAKCLLHYLQYAKKRASRDNGSNPWSTIAELVPLETFESIVVLLHKLETASMSCRSLFSLQRMATKLHASKPCRKKIEEMIGSQLDKATLDDILISRHHHNGSLYDVNLILRLVKTFLQKLVDAHSVHEIESVKGVGSLLDKYLTEIAPDTGLSAVKFKAVAESLPDYARDFHDDLYRALDIYLEAHPRVKEEEATELCKVIDFNKLSMEASKHAAQSLRFPARVTLQVLMQEQANLKVAMNHQYNQNGQKVMDTSALLSSTSTMKRLGSNVGGNHTSQHYQHQDIPGLISPSATITACNSLSKSSNSSFAWDYSLHSHSSGSSRRSLYDQMALDFPPEELYEQDDYHLVLQQNEELRTDLQRMQSRMSELEKACGQMRSKVTKYMKTKHQLLC